MNVSQIVAMILGAYGLSSKKFEGFLNSVMATLSIPEEQQAAVAQWIEENAGVSSERAKQIALLVWAELKSGAPGFDPQHPGGA